VYPHTHADSAAVPATAACPAPGDPHRLRHARCPAHGHGYRRPSNNVLKSITFTTVSNALVSVNGQTDVSSPFAVQLPGGTKSTHVIVRRSNPGAMHVNLVVVDLCGPWQTFVGGGAGMP